MEKLKISLENCYGIAKLEKEFDYTNGNAKIIYAPNGCMKTSFAKTMDNISKKKLPEDEIYPERKSIYKITVNDTDINSDQILVFQTYSDSYSSKDKMNSLLVNSDLKQRYNEILNSIDNRRIDLFKNIKSISGSSNAETEINVICRKKTIFESLNSIKEEVNNNVFIETSYKYGDIINLKVQDFLKANSTLISEYIDTYTKLVSASTFFKRGIFGTENASVITKSLNDNHFFAAKHKLVLENGENINEVSELEQLIKTEKERILKDDILVKKFEKIDLAISKNVELKTLKRILEADPPILELMLNYELFKKQLWINYLSNYKESFNSLLDEYNYSQSEISKIIDQALSEKTEWETVVDLFNNRFDVPYKLRILNQDDVILKDKITPNIAFTYSDGRGEPIDIEENSFKLKALSTGESRALYLLNVIFEIIVKEKEEKDCLLIFDDIADSFDYKNKYAIIEYLKDISEVSFFKMIILTHNFDFYRTVASRLPIKRKDCFMTIKNDDEVKIVEGDYLKNVFDSWVKLIEKDPAIYIASIPFARNLIEYIKGQNEDYNSLTNLLHIKPDTKKITTNDLSKIYKTIWADKTFPFPNKTLYELIFEETEKIILDNTETIQLKNKIILSISIRLLAEEYMINKILDKEEIEKIEINQTTKLTKLYKEKFPKNLDELKIIEQVNLMTAENIHINAFMYEPILDLSDKHLKDLYNKLKVMIK